MTSREKILNKLRAAAQPFPDAPPRPRQYQPVVRVDDTSPEGLLARFQAETERLMGNCFAVKGDAGVRRCVVDLLRSHQTTHIIAWDFKHIPAKGLEKAIKDEGIRITHPEMHDEFRAETVESIRDAQVGLTGVDAAVAATGTLIVSTAPGRGRIPTILAPVHIVVMTLDQLVPRLEDWVTSQRESSLETIRSSANVCFISGPSRTGDIEMELILGVHGPGKVQVVVKK